MGSGKRIYSVPKPAASSNSSKDPFDRSDVSRSRKMRKISVNDVFDDDAVSEDDKAEPKLITLSDQEAESNERNIEDFDSENDEEIDEDAAFDDLDELRWGGHFDGNNSRISADKPKNKSHFSIDNELNLLNESDYSENSDFTEIPENFEDDPEAVDLSELLDAEDSDRDADIVGKPENKALYSYKDIAIEPYSDADDHQNEIHDQSSPETDDDSENVGGLYDLIDSINHKTSAKKEDSDRKSNQIDESVIPESEFNLHTGSDYSGLNLQSLLEGNSGVSNALKKQVNQIDKLSKDPEGSKKGTLDAPLARNIQDRVEREVAYGETVKDINKWMPLVQKNRKADHLNFPLNQAPEPKVSNASLVDNYSPVNEMEDEINQILKNSGLSNEKEIKESEELALNKLNPEEVKEQRAKLQKMRALLFYAEQKEKRAAKIKSKKYRKIRKKQRLKEKELEKLENMDEAVAQEERIKLEKERALERMSLRHKNGSKWAKKALAMNVTDSNTRQALSDQIRRHEELTSKISGIDSSDEHSEYEAKSDQEIMNSMIEDLEKNKTQVESNSRGIFGMKFMKDRMKEKSNLAKSRIANSMSEFSEHDGYSNFSESEGRKIETGRMKIGGSSDESNTSNLKENVNMGEQYFEPPSDDEDLTKSKSSSAQGQYYAAQNELQDGQNPWMSESGGGALKSKRSKSQIPSRASKSDLAREEKLKQKIQKQDDKYVMNNSISYLESSPISSDLSNSPASSSTNPIPLSGLEKPNDDFTFESQQELMELAFADDNLVEKEFEEEKQMNVDKDAPQFEDVTLPGWGSWAGCGVKSRKRKQFIVPKGDHSIATKPEKRKDYKLSHVIINEKKDKKFDSKYKIRNLPFPYTEKHQYDAMMRNPMGKEWNTANTHRNLVKSRINIKRGEIIQPPKLQTVNK